MALFILIIKSLVYSPLPSPKNPTLFLSNQLQRDLKTSLIKTLKQAQREIVISVYSLSDPDVIFLLNQKAKAGLPITLITDKSHQRTLARTLHADIKIKVFKQRGLMHHKIFVIDDISYLGSSNLTSQSLRMHDNMMMTTYNPGLADFLKKQLLEQSPAESFFQTPAFDLFLLPSKTALQRVLNLIEETQHQIQIAMFTFTHPQILKALIAAQERGVKVTVILDYLSQKGASKKMAEALQQAGFRVYHNRGMQLMHHKIAFLDQKKLIMGSTNWTQSGFTKNHEVLLIYQTLSDKEQHFIQKIWTNLLWEAKKIESN